MTKYKFHQAVDDKTVEKLKQNERRFFQLRFLFRNEGAGSYEKNL